MSQEGEADQPWTVTFRLGPEDLRVAHRTIMLGRYRRSAIIAAFLFLAVGAGSGWVIGIATQSFLPMAISIGAASGALSYYGLLRRAERRAVCEGEHAGLFAEQTLTIGGGGFELTFEDGRKAFYPWRRAVGVGKNSRYLVIRINNNNASIIVPMKAFRSEAYADLFLSVATVWHSRATASDGQSP